MDTITVTQGYAITETITIRDSQDNAITAANGYTPYTGTEVLAGIVRPGRSLAASFTFTPTWLSAANATVSMTLSSANTASLSAGQYLILISLKAGAADPVSIYEAFLFVNYGPGTDLLPKTYCSYDDLLSYAPWIARLQTEVQVAGFSIERGLARAWLDNVIVQHSSWMFLNPTIGQPGFMPQSMFPAMVNQPPNLWLREQLNLDYLVRRQNVLEITAKKSLYFIGRAQLESLSDKQERLALWFGADADNMANALRAEITLGVANPNNQDVWPSVTVDCGRSSLRG